MSAVLAAPVTWESLSGDRIELDAKGRVIDYLDPHVTRPDTPEERIRQGYARVLHEEYSYPRECMAFEAPVNIGSETRFADIAVYRNPEARSQRDQGRLQLVVEAKAPNRQSGRAQLKSYICASSADGGVWVNGTDPAGYFRRVGIASPDLTDWTNIPRHREAWDTVGRYRKGDLRPPTDLKQVFRRCHNAIYRTGADSEDVAMDMVRIILAKYQDEQNDAELCEFRCTPEEYASAEGRRTSGDRVRQLFRDVASAHPDVFPPDEQITISDDALSIVIGELQLFQFLGDDETEQVYDVIGTAFEVYVAAHLKGARGQYFTNRLVVNMMVEILDPGEGDTVLDTSCGSAGFLIACLRYMRRKIMSSQRSGAAKQRALREVTRRLFGIDISPKLVRVAKTNMILNGDGHGGIAHGNTLRDLADLPYGFPFRREAPGKPAQSPTIILTNPPFGASHELRERSKEVLENFQLGHVWAPDASGWLQPTAEISGEGVPPETLFLERCVDLLAPGGKLAIVIARGLLDNRDALAARQYLLRNTRLLGVINCHPNTFAPFNGTKAAIIIVEKKAAPGFQQGEDYPVFMAISQRVGQDSQGREIHKQDESGKAVKGPNGQPIVDHDLGEITRAWREFRHGVKITYDGAWWVPLRRITETAEMRLNPLRYAPEAEKALGQVLELADSESWTVERLGDFATVFNGPRFKRPFADEGVSSGDGILCMYTPKAFFEERGESAKYLDTGKATKVQLRAVETLTLERDWILIVDSGTAGKLLGRVGMTTATHHGTVGNNNLIRVVIGDPARRDYVYQFLRSDLGQTLLLRNVYGTNQDHIEPDDVKDIPVPFPKDPKWLETVSRRVRAEVALRERVAVINELALQEFDTLLGRALSQEPLGNAPNDFEETLPFPDDDLTEMRAGFAHLLQTTDLGERLEIAFAQDLTDQ